MSLTKSDKQIEYRVLGALIQLGSWYKKEVQEAFCLLTKEHFFYPDTKDLFVYLRKLYDSQTNFEFQFLDSIIPDLLRNTLLDVMEVGYLSVNLIGGDIEHLGNLKNIRPKIQILHLLLKKLEFTNDPKECEKMINNAVSEMSMFVNQGTIGYCEDIGSIIDKILTDDDKPTEVNLNLLTWPSLPASSMITIAGRSGAGKSLFGFYLMDQILEVSPNTQALYFNLEMENRIMIQRYAAMLGETKDSLKETIRSNVVELMKKDIQLIDKPLITIEEIEMIARIQSFKKPIGVIVVDYIGLVRTQNKMEAKYIEQGEIAQRLAALGLELNCIVLTLLQVNRNYKDRAIGNRCPETTDAAESTGCERSSSLWMGIELPQKDSDDAQFKDLFIIKNRKSRGNQGHFTIYMDFKNGRFTERNQKTVLLTNSEKNPFKSGYKPVDLG